MPKYKIYSTCKQCGSSQTHVVEAYSASRGAESAVGLCHACKGVLNVTGSEEIESSTMKKAALFGAGYVVGKAMTPTEPQPRKLTHREQIHLRAEQIRNDPEYEANRKRADAFSRNMKASIQAWQKRVDQANFDDILSEAKYVYERINKFIDEIEPVVRKYRRDEKIDRVFQKLRNFASKREKQGTAKAEKLRAPREKLAEKGQAHKLEQLNSKAVLLVDEALKDRREFDEYEEKMRVGGVPLIDRYSPGEHNQIVTKNSDRKILSAASLEVSMLNNVLKYCSYQKSANVHY
jgi:hypothetical protein